MRKPYVSAQWYARHPRAGAIYIGLWSFHWAVRDRSEWQGNRLVHLYQRPRRAVVVYCGLHTILHLRLWRLPNFCEHGFEKGYAWWHRCEYVTADNPDGRPSDHELWPEDAQATEGKVS